MPISLTSTAPSRSTTGASVSNLGTVTVGVSKATVTPIQLMGFVPMYDCTAVECRTAGNQGCPWTNTVFGNVISDKAVSTSTYENDFNTFGVDVQLYFANSSYTTATFTLEKCDSGTCNNWTTKATLNSNTYGQFYALDSITRHKTYSIFSINWGKVLQSFGAGFYRIKFVATVREKISSCLVSDPFHLRQFNCEIANGTVKIEMKNTGVIGAHYGRGKLFDLCGITYYDSLRMDGYFGFEKIAEYQDVYNKYQNGNMNLIRSNAIQEYEMAIKLMPKEYHDRIKIYFMMSDTRLVSDYGKGNPDYNIKQFSIFPNGNYEPKYFDQNYQRMQTVKVKFRAGAQNIIKSLCCSTNVVGGTRPGAI